MIKRPRTLKTLRRLIDGVDDNLHDLVMQRFDLVAEVGQAKREEKVAAEVPAREAEILRRLLGRHRGNFPAGALVRMWREMVGAAISLQADFSVAVAVTEADRGTWDLARDHYGSQVPMTAYRSAAELMRGLAESKASVGVVPIPGDSAEDGWWRALAGSGNGWRVTARLPFAGRGNARGSSEAFVLGRPGAAPSGAVRSLFAIEMRGEQSRGGLVSMLADGAVPATLIAISRASPGISAGLIELDDHVLPDDGRLQNMLASLGDRLAHVASLGIYARPITAADVGAAKQD
jgi:chorismate mutase